MHPFNLHSFAGPPLKHSKTSVKHLAGRSRGVPARSCRGALKALDGARDVLVGAEAEAPERALLHGDVHAGARPATMRDHRNAAGRPASGGDHGAAEGA